MNNNLFPSWNWTVDFWMIKDNEMNNAILFFTGLKVDKNDYVTT